MAKKSLSWQFFVEITPICFTFSLIFLILGTLHSDVGNMACTKMCAYPKSALTCAFWPKTILCLGNQIFVFGPFVVALCVVTIFTLRPIRYIFLFSSYSHLSAEIDCFFFGKSLPSPTVVNSPCIGLTCSARKLDDFLRDAPF